MMTQDVDFLPIVDILHDILGDSRYHNDHRGQITFDCPVCSHDIKGLDEGDGKGNLEVNYKMFVYKCWVCHESDGTHGSIKKLLSKFGGKSIWEKAKKLGEKTVIEIINKYCKYYRYNFLEQFKRSSFRRGW